MKITVGGTMGFKIQGRPYESIDVSSVFTLEKDFPDGQKINQEELDILFDKSTKRLAGDAIKKLAVAIKEYNTTVKKYRELIE